MYYYEIDVCHCYIVVNATQKGVVEIINVKAQAVFYLFICLGALGECKIVALKCCSHTFLSDTIFDKVL